MCYVSIKFKKTGLLGNNFSRFVKWLKYMFVEFIWNNLSI